MKSLKSILTIKIYLLYIINLNAQITNTEILDHSEHRTILTSFLENKGDIIYVIENDRRGYTTTQVKLAQNNELPINILQEDLPFSTDSKWFYDSKNNLKIYLFALTDYVADNLFTDIIEITEENNVYTSKKINNTILTSLEVVTSIALDSVDQVYTLTNFPRLQLFKNGILEHEVFPNISFNTSLHNNQFGEVFLLDSEIDSIFKVNNLEFEFVRTLNLNVKELKNINDEIWILSNENKLYTVESNFQNLPQEIDIPFPLTSLDQVGVRNSNIYILENINNGFRINLFSSGAFTNIKEYEEDFASSNKIHAISDSVFLTSGQFEIDNIANHAFIRRYNLNQEFITKRENVVMKNFELYYLSDTIINGAPQGLWHYGINFTIENLGNTKSTINSIFTSDLTPNFTSGYHPYEHQLKNILYINNGSVLN